MENSLRLSSFLTGGHYLIDEQWGLEQVAKAMTEFELIQKGGVTLEDIGYKAMKEKSGMVSYHFPDGSLIAETKRGENGPGVAGSIVKVLLSGVMRMDDGLCSYGIRSLTEVLAQLDSDPGVRGIILEVDSGGGEVTAGQALFSALSDLSKPYVVAARFMASAALMGSLPSRKIIGIGGTSAHGSIGVVYSMNKGFAEYYAKNIDEIYATTSPEKNLDWREYLKGNDKLYKASADKYDAVFMGMVEKYRPLNVNKKESTLKGAMFLAEDALDRGLIDQIGTMKDAFNYFTQQEDKKEMTNFQSYYNNLMGELNRIFGWNLSTNDAEAAEKQLKGQKPISELISESVNSVKGQMDSLQTKFDALDKEFQALKGSTEGYEKLKSDFTGLEKQVETLTGEKKDLEGQIADLQGKKDLDKDEEGNPISSADRFKGMLQESAEPEGDSKY